MRALALRLHRWTGLAIAAFLMLTAATGVPLAWYDDLDAWIAPGLLVARPAPAGVPLLEAAVVRERVAAAYPQARLPATPLARPAGRNVAFPAWFATGADGAPVLVEVFVDPYTGDIRGTRRWGDITEGPRNLMPFLHRLHTSLLAGPVGEILLGIVALAWTLDCFVGLLLSLPVARRNARAGAPGKPWLSRWRPAWAVRWAGGPHKLTFDLHRAGGLWLWGLLLAMAWSSVALSLPAVFDPVMRAVLPHQTDVRAALAQARADGRRAMEVHEAVRTGRALMRQLAHGEGWDIASEHWLAYDARRGVYRYTVRSSRDVRVRSGATSVYFDVADGVLLGTSVPTGRAAGDTFKHWLSSLHMAAFGGWPMRLAVALLGVAVLMLSCTGILLWLRKRRALRLARQ